jgi:beta propeller repeat protein
MKTNEQLNSVGLVLAALTLFLFLVSSTTSATAAQTAQLSIAGTPISTNDSSAGFPSIYGDRIVWADWSNRNPNTSMFNIYMYNISTSKKTQILTTKTIQIGPIIYGNRIVWSDWEHNIYMYDLSTQKETRIATNESVINGPTIYGDRIIWEDENGTLAGEGDVFMYNVSTSKESRIIRDTTMTNIPIYGDRMVWNDDSTINLYNFSTRKETQILTNESINSPAFYGDRIVYWDFHGIKADIFMYNISTSKKIQITKDGQDGEYGLLCGIYADKILWEVGGNDNSDIYMYDLSTHQKVKITANSMPAIYGNTITWNEEKKDGNDVIYMCNLSSDFPIADFSASPIYGKEPLKVAFSDKSTGKPALQKWSFGDSTYSTTKNPMHTYNEAKKYTVSLTVKNAAGSSTATKSNCIVVTALTPPVASFSVPSASGKVPLTVKFTDKSKGSITSRSWNFGDKNTSTAQNPTHKYYKAGRYTVSLKVKNAAGTNTKTMSITVR